MPAAWVGAGAAVLGAVGSYENGKNKGGGSNGPAQAFSGPNTDLANTGWAGGFNGLQNVANTGYNTAAPLYAQSLQQQQGINYNDYLQNANQVGGMYGNLSNTEQGQANTYGQAGQQLFQRAFDPNMAQYNQQAQQLGGQVNAGQAARGLGNSPVGGAEYNNAMGNFNTQWNAQQLQNEESGIQAMGQAFTGQAGAGQQAAGYLQQSGQIPLQAQQYVAGQPAANASAYTQEMGGLQSLYGNVTGQALPYITGGQGAQQFNTGYNTQQNAANMNLLTQGAQGLYSQYNTPGSWLSNVFNGQGQQSGQGSLSNQDQNSIWQSNAAAGYGYGGV